MSKNLILHCVTTQKNTTKFIYILNSSSSILLKLHFELMMSHLRFKFCEPKGVEFFIILGAKFQLGLMMNDRQHLVKKRKNGGKKLNLSSELSSKMSVKFNQLTIYNYVLIPPHFFNDFCDFHP